MANNNNGDRFTSLPDPVLLHIFSFLPFDDVVRTTLLCTQFNSLWTQTTHFNFIHKLKDLHSTQKFVTFVDKALLHVHSSIDRFHLEFPFNRCFSADVVVWVLFSLNRKVKELNLLLNSEDSDEFILPSRLFENPLLEKLSVDFCGFEEVGLVKFESLKELRVGFSQIGDDAVRRVLFGSPVLEFLEMKHCWGFKRLDLVSGNLKALVLDGYGLVDTFNPIDVLEIVAPSVKVLEIKGCFKRMSVDLRNISSCVVANLDFYLSPMEDDDLEKFYEEQRQMLMRLLSSLWHVKDLKLGSWCVEIISTFGLNRLPFCLDCQCLTLLTAIQERYLPGIVILVKCSPNVRTLTIQMAPHYFEFEKIQTDACFSPWDCVPLERKVSKTLLDIGPLSLVRNIKIRGFEGMRTGQEILFMRYLLTVCPNLDNMVIEWKRHLGFSDMLVANSLVTSPKCSRKATVSVHHG